MRIPHTTWARKSPYFPEHFDHMEVLPEDGRIVSAIVVAGDPVRYGPEALSYIDVEDGLIRIQLRPGGLE